MKRAIMATAIMIFLTCVSSQAQDLKVKEVRGKTAVIEDGKTGKKHEVREGERFGDWTVAEVTDQIVTLEREDGPNRKIRGQLLVNGLMRLEHTPGR